MPVKAVYPGTFDPLTRGHLDLIERGSRLFSRLIVAVAENPEKMPLFDLEERVEMIRESIVHLEGVEVMGFHGLLVDFAREHDARVILKGLRTVSDFEYELQMAQMNREMHPEIETLFLPAGMHVNFLSSSLLKEIFRSGGNVDEWLPPAAARKLRSRLG